MCKGPYSCGSQRGRILGRGAVAGSISPNCSKHNSGGRCGAGCIRLATVLLIMMTAVVGDASRGSGNLLRLRKSFFAMATPYSIILYGYDRGKMEAAIDSAFGELHRLDKMLSNYMQDSEWCVINREAPLRPVAISPELFDLLTACLEYSRQSEGAFDITTGRLMRVWRFYKGKGELPDRGDLAEALNHVGYRHLLLDPATKTVRFGRPGLEVDPGGIGKGYAVDRMVDVLRRSGFSVGFVAASGSSLYGIGAPPTEPMGWEVNIADPWGFQRPLAKVFLKDMSISTSGSYERYFRANGQTYSHIIDPRTGFPAHGTSQVSVVAPRAIESEAWSKPYFINGRAWATGHPLKGFRIFLCDDEGEKTCEWLGCL